MTVFLDHIDDAAAARLTADALSRRWPSGSVLFHEGDRADRVLLVRTGHVKLVATEANGTELVLAVRRPGDLLGELAAIDGLPRSATAISVGEVECAVVTAEHFMAAMADEPSIVFALTHVLASRLREADGRRVEQSALDSVQRVARRIVELAGDTTTVEGLNQDDLARLVGSSRESVAKALQKLRNAGVVRTGRRRIEVVDADGLRQLAGL